MEAPEAYPSGYVEDAFEARTTLGERRVSARQGWAGEKRGFSAASLGTAEHVIDERPVNIGTAHTDCIEQRFMVSHEIPGVS